jgi:hypothetical protein
MFEILGERVGVPGGHNKSFERKKGQAPLKFEQLKDKDR